MAEGRFSKLEKKEGEAASAPPGTVSRDSRPAAVEEAHASGFLLSADEAFFTGNYKEALRNYSRALQQENNQVYPWIGQISCLIELEQYREAELWSNKALEQFPEDSSLLSQRARVLAATGNLKRAIGVSDYALGKGPTQWTWLARGEVLLMADDANAMFCFEKAMEAAGGEDWRVPMLAGLAFGRKRQWASSEDFLKRAIQVNGRNFFIWYELAKVLVELSYTDRARDAIARVKQLKPDFGAVRDLELKLYRRPFLQRVMGMFKR